MLAILLPRGIRNHNPGNIRLSKSVWQGQRPAPQADPEFAEFTAPLWGLRALMRLLLTYHLKYGLDTPQSLINRYAPPHENATDSYVRDVARALGVRRGDRLRLTDTAVLARLARAIVRREQGRPPAGYPPDWYDDALYAEAARLALSSPAPLTA